MDSNALLFPDNTFTHSIGNAFIFILPNDGIDALKEIYRTLKPGGIAVMNSWAYVPNMDPLHAAARATRPEGTPLPRQGMDKWSNPAYLESIMKKAGFNKVIIMQADIYATVSEITRYATMLWSFIGGTTSVGWLKSDEENWEKAVDVVKKELEATDGYRVSEGGRPQLKFVANIAIATK